MPRADRPRSGRWLSVVRGVAPPPADVDRAALGDLAAGMHGSSAMQAFRDRRDAGRELARRLDHLAGNPDVTVLALPRGGVPVGYEIARRLGAPLDVLVVRKLGVPGHSELA